VLFPGDAEEQMPVLPLTTRRCTSCGAKIAPVTDLVRAAEGRQRAETGTEEVKCPLLSVRAPRPSRAAQANRAAKRLFRHGLEAFAPKGAFLLQMLADGNQLVVADAL
jgi:hypothetical protein